MSRRPINKIHRHEDQQPRAGYIRFVGTYWAQQIGTPLPDVANARGAVRAYINHSRWIAECPNQGCGGAFVASLDHPYFICIECGSAENGGNWYTVVFPPDREEYETALLFRPGIPTRNWDARDPEDTLARLRQENRERGLPDGLE